MLKIFKIILAMFVVVSAGGSFASAASYANQADIDIIATSNKSYTDFIRAINEEESVANGTVLARAAAASSVFNNVAGHKFSSKLGVKYIKKSAEVKKYAGEIKVLLDKVTVVLRERDYNTVNQYLEQIRDSVKKYSTAIEEMNKAASESNSYAEYFFLLVTIAIAAMAVGSFVWFAIGRVKQLSPSLLAARKSVAFSSLAPLVGAVVTYATFMLASNTGGTYTIAYGLILVGSAVYIISVVQYITLARKTSAVPPVQSTTTK
jgi:hypothetical protein